MTKERWERLALFHERIALSLIKNERFAQKTDERIPYPGFYCNMICREQILTSRPDALNIFTFQTADKTKCVLFVDYFNVKGSLAFVQKIVKKAGSLHGSG